MTFHCSVKLKMKLNYLNNCTLIVISVICVRDSLFLTALSIIVTISLRYILHCKMSVPTYIGKTIDISSSNIVGRFLLPKPNPGNDVLIQKMWN